jgi:hypothetical protein
MDAINEEAHAIQVPRLFLLESELVRAQITAELDWVRSVVADLKSGTLTWSPEWLDEIAQRFALPVDATTYRQVKPSVRKETQA